MINLSNKIHWLEEQQMAVPSSAAIILKSRSLTYPEFWEECLSMRDYLHESGIRKEDHAGILFGHSYRFLVIVNALWLIGAVPVPLNTRSTNTEIATQLKLATIRHLIFDEIISAPYSDISCQNRIMIPDLERIHYPAKMHLTHNSHFSIQNSSLIMFTSGSSGKSKAVMHNFNNLLESARNLDSVVNLEKNDLWLASLPFYHIGGFMIMIRSLLSGGTIAFPDSLSHKDIVWALTRFRPAYFSVVPTVLGRLIQEKFEPTPNLKIVFVGGGPALSADILKAIDAGWPVAKVYGSTETCSMIALLLPEEVKHKSESAGRIIGSNKIKIRRVESAEPDNLCATGETGEIFVSSSSLFKEYFNDKMRTERLYRNGWYQTGDFGWLDEDGFLYISSRREDLIITGGENVSAQEVENIIKTHKQIEDSFVFALDDAEWGQLVCAAIVSDKVSEPEIINFLRERIAGYKIPKRFFFLELIPRNEMGKVNRQELIKNLSPG